MKIVHVFAVWMISAREDLKKKKRHKTIDPYFHQDPG